MKLPITRRDLPGKQISDLQSISDGGRRDWYCHTPQTVICSSPGAKRRSGRVTSVQCRQSALASWRWLALMTTNNNNYGVLKFNFMSSVEPTVTSWCVLSYSVSLFFTPSISSYHHPVLLCRRSTLSEFHLRYFHSGEFLHFWKCHYFIIISTSSLINTINLLVSHKLTAGHPHLVFCVCSIVLGKYIKKKNILFFFKENVCDLEGALILFWLGVTWFILISNS